MARGGPKTAEGKAVVRANPVRHGMRTVLPVIPGVETAADWEAHRAGVVESLAPEGTLEGLLAERAALLLWRLARVGRYETAMATAAHGLVPFESAGGYYRFKGEREVDEIRRYAEADFGGEKTLEKIMRYEGHLNRQLTSTLHELEALQARRQGQAAPLARLDVQGLPEG